ncbi:MAG: hydroxylamine reductase [Oscillospiraceae bacterium]|nr:hydroxylamine reductase [Oscillospiraceae bacterium]
MFCFQCEQTAKGTACTVGGVCGKKADTANLQDALTGELIGLAMAMRGATGAPGAAGAADAADGTGVADAASSTPGAIPEGAAKIVIDSLFATVTNVSFNNYTLMAQIKDIARERERTATGSNGAFDMAGLWGADEDVRSLKSLILFGLRGMAAYAHHARVLGKADDVVDSFFIKGLSALGEEKTADELLALVMELGQTNLKCMELLDAANTGAFGDPMPTKVTSVIEPGPFIVVSGHDLRDLKLLLEATQGKGVNIYTHSEMLPAHGYPELKKFAHLKGNFGTAWQNQQNEFDKIPAPVLFTTNCLMPVKPNYADRVFTTSVVAYPGIAHIGEDKDFSPLIDKAHELGGYKEQTIMKGINGGDTLTVGFAKNTVLSVAGTVIDAVKAGAIKHFFLVGGCDGARPGRNYYTEFVRQSPKDTVILTLACGKYRFNDMDAGEIGGLPRIMDMGQCNDAYSAIKVASALAEAFECNINELPLTLVLSWYEQKAVCILLTLLALGIKNIYIGPSLPAFISPNILNVIVEKFNLTPISTPEADLKKILG